MTNNIRRIVLFVALGVGAAGCRATHHQTASMASSLMFLTRDGCANSEAMRANLDAALHALNQPAAYQVIDQDTLPKTDPRSGYATPTLLYTNRDLFGMPEPKPPYPEPT